MTSTALLAVAPAMLVATATETSEFLTMHMTLGELLVAVSAVMLGVVTVVLVWASLKVEKATIMDANLKLSEVANRSNDNMADVAEAAINHKDAPEDVPPDGGHD